MNLETTGQYMFFSSPLLTQHADQMSSNFSHEEEELQPLATGLEPNKTRLWAVPWLYLIMLYLMTSNCLGSNIIFVGSGYYNVSGNSVVLRADKILNNDFGGFSGTIRLELWAFSVPYPGTTFGYKLASYVVGQLNGGYYYYNINSGSIPFVTPPPGTWYFSLQAREYTASGGDGYTTRDWFNYSSPVRVAGGASFGDVRLIGLTSWQVVGSVVTLAVEKVSNICNLGVSGSLRLDLWATTFPYAGGTIVGNRFGSVSLNPLTAGYDYFNIYQTVPYARPPDGAYYVTLTLGEYRNGAYVTVDYLNYGTPLVVGDPPPAPTAKPATSVTSNAFTANWSSTPGASGYRLDVSANDTFSNYIGGYQNLDVGNVTSKAVSGLSAGTMYYYRVRAYNGIGTSGNSVTISAITVPPAPTATAASSVTSNAFTANWSSTPGASGYRLDVSANDTFSNYISGYQNLDVGNVTTKAVSGLSAGKMYYYRVRAYNGIGTSGNSVTISAITVPPAPTATAATSVTSNAFTANWSTTTGASGYRLDVSANATFSNYIGGYQDLDVGNVTTKAVTGLSAGTMYYYRVRAYDTSGTSGSSGTITVTTSSAPSPPPTLGYARRGNNLVLSWPTNDPAFKLEFTTNLPGSIWTSNSVSPSIVGGKYTITNTMPGNFKLYRLRK